MLWVFQKHSATEEGTKHPLSKQHFNYSQYGKRIGNATSFIDIPAPGQVVKQIQRHEEQHLSFSQ